MTGDETTRPGAVHAALEPSARMTVRSRRSSSLPVPRPCRRGDSARTQGVGQGDRGIAARRGRRLHRVADREKSDWKVGGEAGGRRPRTPVPAAAAPHRRAVPPLRRASARTSRAPYVDAIEARGIPHLLVGGKAFHGREEVETIRAALAAIEWPDDELSVFATLKGRSSRSTTSTCSSSVTASPAPFHPFRIPKELGGNSGQDLALSGEPTSHLMPIADALRLLQQLHRARNYRPVADTIGAAARRDARARRVHPAAGRRAGARQRARTSPSSRVSTSAAAASRFRGFIDELRTAAASESRRGADSRRGQRRRPPDDRAQGQGARVPGRHPRGPHLPHEPQRREPLSRRVARAVRDEDRRMGAARAARARSRGGGARSGRRRPARVRRGDARARSARRAGAWRRPRGTAAGSAR